MRNKHTEGPWKVFGEKSNINITARFLNGTDPYRMPIAYMQTEENCNDSMANAQLMAAAPELLAACEAVMQMYEDDSMFRHPRNCDAILKTEQAIAKVKGK